MPRPPQILLWSCDVGRSEFSSREVILPTLLCSGALRLSSLNNMNATKKMSCILMLSALRQEFDISTLLMTTKSSFVQRLGDGLAETSIPVEIHVAVQRSLEQSEAFYQ